MYEISFSKDYLGKAADLCDQAITNFFDPAVGMFYFTQMDQSDIPIRKIETFDSAMPSANSTMFHNLKKLSVLIGRSDLGELAEKMALKVLGGAEKYTSSFANWARGMVALAKAPKEIAIIGPDALAWAKIIQQSPLHNYVIMAAEQEDDKFPLLANKSAILPKQTLIYICENFVCHRPVSKLEEAFAELFPDQTQP